MNNTVKIIAIYSVFFAMQANAEELLEKMADTKEVTASRPKKNCQQFGPQAESAQVTAGLSGQGTYCLTENMKQRSVWDISSGFTDHGSPGRSGVIGIFKSNSMTVDLDGHLITGAPFDDTTGVDIHRNARNIEVRNGTISNPGKLGLGVTMAPYKVPELQDSSFDDVPPAIYHAKTADVDPPLDPWNYLPATNYTLDHLNIQAGGRAVIMAGTGNVVRNCTIDVDSATAILSYGPNALIEGNTIVVHQAQGDPTSTTAALKLRDADGTIIRNNKIVVKGGVFSKAKVAINLLASHGVVIENNVIEGAEALVRKDADSTTVESGNTVH